MFVKICEIRNLNELRMVEKYADATGVVMNSLSIREGSHLKDARTIICETEIPVFLVSTMVRFSKWAIAIERTNAEYIKVYSNTRPLSLPDNSQGLSVRDRIQRQKEQILKAKGSLPDVIVACVGGGSNAMGIFHPFVNDKVRLIGVEAGGKGLHTELHSASLNAGQKGVFHGMLSYFLQNEEGQIMLTHSIAAGLDYPGVGPEHAYLKESGKAEYVTVTDEEALRAFHEFSRTEGIIPALESAHAVAYAMKLAKEMRRDEIIIVNLSGRGDKDLDIVLRVSRNV